MNDQQNKDFWDYVHTLQENYQVPIKRGGWDCISAEYKVEVFKWLVKWYAYSGQHEAKKIAKKLVKMAKIRLKDRQKAHKAGLKRDLAQAPDEFHRMWAEFCLYGEMPPKRKKEHVPCVRKPKK